MADFNISNLLTDTIDETGEIMFRNPSSSDVVKHKKATFADMVDFLDGEGIGQGLPNYLSGKVEDWTTETGVTLAENTDDPLVESGDIEASFTAVASGSGFYQDITLDEVDTNSLLQINGYFKGIDGTEVNVEIVDQTESETFAEYTLSEIAENNAASGVYQFRAIFNTTDETSLRIRFKANTTLTDAFQFCSFSLGAPFYYTAPSTGEEAGTIKILADDELPTDFLHCDGTAVSRTDYSELFAKIGETWGAGDGSTTFNLPDLRGVFLRGSGANATLVDANGNPFDGGDVGDTALDQMQQITGSFSLIQRSGGSVQDDETGAFSDLGNTGSSKTQELAQQSGTNNNITTGFDSADSPNARTGDETQPVNATVKFIIRYRSVRSVELMASQTNREDAGSMYYDYEAPTDGLNRMGDLAFGSTGHSWATYPQLNAIGATDLAMYVDDNGDGTFDVRDLSYDTGWVSNSDWTNAEFTISHTLNINAPYLNIEFWVSTDGTEPNAFKIMYAHNGSSNGIGFTIEAIGTDSFKLQTGSNGILYTDASGTVQLLDSESWYYKVIVSRKDAPQEGTYAYLRTKSLSSVILAQMQSEAGYNGTVYRPTVLDISAGNQSTDLDVYLSTGTNPKLDGWKIKVTWKDGDATYYHKFASTHPFYNEFTGSLAPGDPTAGTPTYAWCGYGSGGLTLIKDEANSQWIVETDGCFDKGTSGSVVFKQFVDKELHQRSPFTSTGSVVTYTHTIEFADATYRCAGNARTSDTGTSHVVKFDDKDVDTVEILVATGSGVSASVNADVLFWGEWRD